MFVLLVGNKRLFGDVMKIIKQGNSEVNSMAEGKDVECRFAECDDCIFDGTNALCCMVSRLGLACHRLVQSIPIINLFTSSKQCEWVAKE